MAGEPSYVGPGILKFPRRGTVRKRMGPPRKVPIIAILAIAALLFSMLLIMGNSPDSGKATKSLSVTTLPIVLSCQHYDTGMPCLVPPPPPNPAGPHMWNDSAGIDGIYGNADDCPHCSAYCAPASISMIATYRNFGAPNNLQDQIYDQGKSVPPEVIGSGSIETHGVGMFHGAGGFPAEVQTAMTWALGGAQITEHNWTGGNPKGPMTYPLLLGYMSTGTPILWLDNGGWPVNQSSAYPSLSNRMDQGHAKVIAGHDDKNTPADPTDDLCLIYDPWPEYNDTGILPLNCTKGPGGTWNPYWQPLNDVNFSDKKDVYLVDTFPAIPEFSAVIVPVVGMMVIAAVAFGLRREQET